MMQTSEPAGRIKYVVFVRNSAPSHDPFEYVVSVYIHVHLPHSRASTLGSWYASIQ